MLAKSPRSFHLPTRLTERSAKVPPGMDGPKTIAMHWKSAAAAMAQNRLVYRRRAERWVRKNMELSMKAIAAKEAKMTVSHSMA